MVQIWLRIITLVIAIGYSTLAAANTPSEIDITQNTQLIESFYKKGGEGLPTAKVIALAQQVIRFRRLYHGDIIAKTYVLLADVAVNKGDMEQARQFSLDGLKVVSLDRSTRLKLLLKVALANYSQGKFIEAKERADEVLKLAGEEDVACRIQAIGYRAVYYALDSQYEEAVIELEQINRIAQQYQQYGQQIDVLEILARTYHYLEDYETAISLQLKVLRLRFELNLLTNLGTTYYSLASAYWKMGKLDDAYNAFWEAKVEAEKVDAPIRIAHAELGLGRVLYDQGNVVQAQSRLKKAESLFNGQNLTTPYLTSLIILAKVSFELNQVEYAHSLLVRARKLSTNVELTTEQIELYYLLSKMYSMQGKYELAWQSQKLYVDHLIKHNHSMAQYRFLQVSPYNMEAQARKMALDIADKTDLEAQYVARYESKKKMIVMLSILVALLLSVIVILMVMRRRDKQAITYKEYSQPVDILPDSGKTKQIYQTAFKQARRYEYPICVAYIKVTNWRDMEFRTNKKGVDEAKRSIATVVNEYIEEFDLAGELNTGEYLLIFPHQTLDEVQVKIKALTEALRVRFFANLGDFVVYFNYAVDTPTVQDIEPYIFLSRLTDSIREEDPFVPSS